jgi:hypothetical protein
MDAPAAEIIHHRYTGAKAAGKFIGSIGCVYGYPCKDVGRQGDEPSPAGDGINKAGKKNHGAEYE